MVCGKPYHGRKQKTEEIAVGKRQQVNRMENCEKQENNKKKKNK